MPRVVYKPDVAADLRTIVAYLDAHSIRAADRFLDKIYPAIIELAAMPGMASLKNFKTKSLRDVRSWSVRGYRQFLILYRPIPDGIEILAVTHGARRLRSLLHNRSR